MGIGSSLGGGRSPVEESWASQDLMDLIRNISQGYGPEPGMGNYLSPREVLGGATAGWAQQNARQKQDDDLLMAQLAARTSQENAQTAAGASMYGSDAARYGHELGLQGHLAGNESRWAAENLRSQTGLQEQAMKGQSAKDVAGIMANPKGMIKPDPMTLMRIYQTLQNPKSKPEELQAAIAYIQMLRSGDPTSVLQKELDRRAAPAMVDPTASTWSMPRPEIRPDSILSKMQMPGMGNRWAAEDMLP